MPVGLSMQLDFQPLIVVGGIISEDDKVILKQIGVSTIYTPKDFEITGIMAEVVKLVDKRTGDQAA